MKTESKSNQMIKRYWQIFTQDIWANKVIFFTSLITTIASYGFAITNFSIGIDDPMRDYYMYSKNFGTMIQQGRLSHVLINELTGLIDFIPFFNEFLAAGLFFISALLFAAFLQLITNNRFSTFTLSAFCCIYLSYSITNEKFIYNLDVVAIMLSYCCAALALTYSYCFVENMDFGAFFRSLKEDWLTLVKATLTLLIAISSYETFVTLYMCGVFIIFILKILVAGETFTFKEFMRKGLLYAGILCVCTLFYYALVILVQIADGQYGIFHRESAWRKEIPNIFKLTKGLLYGFKEFTYLPVLEFVIISLIGGIYTVFSAIRKRSWIIPICFAGLFFSSILIHYVVGYLMNRASQTFCLYVAVMILLILWELRDISILKKPLIVAVTLLIILQAADMNRMFYNDYKRFQKESFAINTVATALASECDVSKPVVFTNSECVDYLANRITGMNGSSMIEWGVDAFHKRGMYDVFIIYGYDFLVQASEEQMDEAQELSLDMPAFPVEGYILETEDYIVVNMGVPSE